MPELYIGLMSGTSLDGIDGVLADLSADPPQLIAHHHLAFAPELRRELLALNQAENDELRRAALAANRLARAYAETVHALLARHPAAKAIKAIGCHGQTVRHQPAEGYTIQLVNGALLAELTGIDVVCDFRSRDIAAGGEGAPLAPAFHRSLFHSPRRHRAVVNVGGIANITWLPARGKVTGFDCGPGNCLLDAWIMQQRRKPYDPHGAWAARGSVMPRLLQKWLAHPFFRRPPPKSTGREEFNLPWVRRALSGTERAVDVQATLLELTATAIAQALRNYCPSAAEIYLCGGGAHNRALFLRLVGLLPDRLITTTSALGLAPEHVEALAFAWLARQTLNAQPGNLPAVTGARGARILGALHRA